VETIVSWSGPCLTLRLEKSVVVVVAAAPGEKDSLTKRTSPMQGISALVESQAAF